MSSAPALLPQPSDRSSEVCYPRCLWPPPSSCLLTANRNELLHFHVTLSRIDHIGATTGIAKANGHTWVLRLPVAADDKRIPRHCAREPWRASVESLSQCLDE